jgi:hypothetical protein
MKIQFARLLIYLPAVLLTACTSGCATSALWRHTASHEWKSGRPTQVLLITDTNQQRDVAILFRQNAQDGATNELKKEGRPFLGFNIGPFTSPPTFTTRNVAWRISQPPEQLALTPKTIRQLTNSCCNVQPIPIYDAREAVPGNEISPSAAFAVWNATDRQLTVHGETLPSGPFTLPSTSQKQNTALRVVATPAAIVADAALVGSEIALFITFVVLAGMR